MTDLTFRAIDRWPDGWRNRANDDRTPTPFRAKYSDTLTDLDDELYHLGAVTCHVQLAGIAASDLRLDGRLRAHTKVDHPGVILTVVTKTRTLVLGTDRFYAAWSHQGEDWHHNLRAAVLGLRDLRRLERYGLAGGRDMAGDAQYAGFAALPSGGPVALPSGMTRDEALAVLRDAAGPDGADSQSVQDLYRLAARRLHPDTSEGDADRMAEVNRARDVLVASHG